MKRKLVMAVATAGLVIAGLVGYQVSKPGKPVKSLAQKMVFDPGIYLLTGDEFGRVCTEFIFSGPDGKQSIARRFLYKHDFRTMTDKQKEDAIREAYADTMEGSGLACKDPAGGWFPDVAYAQPHCESTECGGGCGTLACPATVVTGGGCVLGGTNCVIVFICCSGPCTCG